MDSDEECFNKFIVEVNESDESEKENKQGKRPRTARTKKEQFEKIVYFMKNHNEEVTDVDVFAGLWDTLTEELNAIGPPTHSNVEWKRIWSVYKYNRKRKRGDLEEKRTKSYEVDIMNRVFERLDTIITRLDTSIHILKEIAQRPN